MVMLVYLFLLIVGGILLAAMIWSVNVGIDNDPFYMGDDRPELWIDYCKVCKTRHTPKCEGE